MYIHDSISKSDTFVQYKKIYIEHKKGGGKVGFKVFLLTKSKFCIFTLLFLYQSLKVTSILLRNFFTKNLFIIKFFLAVIGIFSLSLNANISGSSDWIIAILGLFESTYLGLCVIKISYCLC